VTTSPHAPKPSLSPRRRCSACRSLVQEIHPGRPDLQNASSLELKIKSPWVGRTAHHGYSTFVRAKNTGKSYCWAWPWSRSAWPPVYMDTSPDALRREDESHLHFAISLPDLQTGSTPDRSAYAAHDLISHQGKHFCYRTGGANIITSPGCAHIWSRPSLPFDRVGFRVHIEHFLCPLYLVSQRFAPVWTIGLDCLTREDRRTI
jgi:hypothetical protein